MEIQLLDPVENNDVRVDAYAVAQFKFEGAHVAPHAPAAISCETCDHFHTFHVRALMKIRHSERDIWPQVLRANMLEWIKDYFREHVLGPFPNLEQMTCAALARQLLIRFNLEECEVLEDGQAGAILKRKA
jgi:hypothetical protein